MVRDSYWNLNGTWDYRISTDSGIPPAYDGTILVPFSPESPLSGVKRQLLPGEYLWYRRHLTLPCDRKGKRVILHFGAVDQECVVYLNGREAGSHAGGYLPFSLDITESGKVRFICSSDGKAICARLKRLYSSILKFFSSTSILER